jgi:hypothetical protein
MQNNKFNIGNVAYKRYFPEDSDDWIIKKINKILFILYIFIIILHFLINKVF